MTRPRIPDPMVQRLLVKSNNKCTHCHIALDTTKRSNYHIDHHPVAYRDIDGQCCIGVRDPLDETNLVASCPSCNLSHAHEHEVCCGRTQIPCKIVWGWRAGAIGVFLFSNLITYYAARCN